MKLIKYIAILTSTLLLVACGENGGKPTVTGNAYEILIVVDDSVYNSAAGDSILSTVKSFMPCMPQSEQYFKVSRIDNKSFSDIFKPVRNIVIMEVSSKYSKVRMFDENDKWAAPQSIIHIHGPNVVSVAEAIGKYKNDIRDYFINAEHRRASAYYAKNFEKAAMDSIYEKFGVSMTVPKGFNRFKSSEDFLWCACSEREIQEYLIVYTSPYCGDSTFTLENILQKRDSVLKRNIPGPSDSTYMTTEYKYDPPVFKHTALFNGNYASEVRGLWRVEGDLMGGPFVSLSCYDKENKRVITAEAFLYGPNKDKRNTLRQLESNLYTITFNNSTEDGTQD